MTLEDLNRELDNNSMIILVERRLVNEIILLLNRRRGLVLNKKRRLQEEFYNKINELKRYPLKNSIKILDGGLLE